MEKNIILLSEYCKKSHTEPAFILELENEGLIKTLTYNDAKYINLSQLNDLEMFTRLYYDLSINVERIDVIKNFLSRMRRMEHELLILRRRMDNESYLFEDFFDEI